MIKKNLRNVVPKKSKDRTQEESKKRERERKIVKRSEQKEKSERM